MAQLTIFLDDGGVMNDNLLRAAQWQRLVGEFFIPLLGGTSEAWREANRLVADDLFQPDAWQARLLAFPDYNSFDFAYQLEWLRGMCEFIGLVTPSDEECMDLSNRATAFITRRVFAAFPGVVETIRQLYNQGYTLHTASGESSLDLKGYLIAMKVGDCFGRLYGPDLINTFKNGPEYYERIFADLALHPEDALVVDDNPGVLSWAAQLGARTVLVSSSPSPAVENRLSMKSLAELPSLILQLT